MAEMDGSTLHRKVAKFRVIPYFQRKAIPLPRNIYDWIDLSEKELDELSQSEEPSNTDEEASRDLWFSGSKMDSSNNEESDLEPSSEEEEEEETSSTQPRRSRRLRN